MWLEYLSGIAYTKWNIRSRIGTLTASHILTNGIPSRDSLSKWSFQTDAVTFLYSWHKSLVTSSDPYEILANWKTNWDVFVYVGKLESWRWGLFVVSQNNSDFNETGNNVTEINCRLCKSLIFGLLGIN